MKTPPTNIVRESRGFRRMVTAQGTILSARGGSGNFRHPFTPSLTGGRVRLSRGLVDAFEPLIGKVPLTGDEKNPVPALKLDPEERDKETEQSWVCIEVTPDAEGKILTAEQIAVVHRSEPFRFTGPVGRQPVALVLWRKEKPVQIFSQVWFNLRYISILPAAGQGGRRHFFL